MKRFYKDAVVGERGPEGFGVLLDGKPVKTPGGRAFAVRAKPLAEALAAEWAGQGETIAPTTMPLTRQVNTVLDRVGPNRSALLEDLRRYAGADLLCYRATMPPELVEIQRARFDPWVAHAARRWSVHLTVVPGLTHVAQAEGALDTLMGRIASQDDNRLSAITQVAGATTSAVLGLAVAEGALQAKEALYVAQADEDFQISRWGLDGEAEERRANLLADMDAIDIVLNLGGV